jgi:hypothetical protein
MMETQPMLGGNGFAVYRNLNPNLVRVETLRPLGRETRKHPPAQIRKLQASIEQFGFVLPIVIDATSRVIAGWGLALAAKKLGLPEVPAVTITDLDEPKLRMLRLALNRLSEDSRWDLEALRLEFSDIMEISGEIDLRISGFEMGEIDVAFEGSGSDEEDDLPALNETSTPVTKPGDLWLLGEHRILCANALMSESYARLLGDERAQMIFTDPPGTFRSPAMSRGSDPRSTMILRWAAARCRRRNSRPFCERRLAMPPVTRTTVRSTSCACIGERSENFSPLRPIYSPRQKTCASGARQMLEWDRSTGQGTSSYLCSREEMRRTSTT